MSDALDQLTELAQRVADAKAAEEIAAKAYFSNWDYATKEHDQLATAYEKAREFRLSKEHFLACTAVNLLLK